MPKFLDTTRYKIAAVAICDRCRTKVPYEDLHPDDDNKSLRVCDKCNDQRDPYKLPQRRPEKITLRYPRPEEELE